jgi:hypothetical protein
MPSLSFQVCSCVCLLYAALVAEGPWLLLLVMLDLRNQFVNE